MQHDATSKTQFAQAQPPRTGDFKLRPPAAGATPVTSSPPAATTPPPPASPRPADPATTQTKPYNAPNEAMTPTSLLIGSAILVVLAIVFLLISRAARGHLIGHKASPATAGSASWALFAFLLSVAATSVFGFLGNLWSVLAFIIPMGLLIAVTLILCVVLFNSGRRVAR